MANIIDYLDWRGDISLTKDFPFNEVDSMIMARFSYLVFDKIKMREKETIKDIASKMKDIPNDKFLWNGDKELISNLGFSLRFKNLIVTDYIKVNNRSQEKQFGAITIHLSDEEMYVSFIGTDATIYGWKEDFNMGFMEHVPCQIMGREYLDNIAIKYPNKKIRIGGHSKGGNVAIYSAITIDKKIQDRIIKVYNYDGPGFNKDIINKYETNNIIKKIETYIPQDSIIGRVLYHKEKTTIVLSLEKGILEHDIFTWQILKNDLVRLARNTETSEMINKTLIEWVETTTNEQREILIDAIFELFYSTDANSFGEIKDNLMKNIPKIMKKYSSIKEEDKKVVTDMLGRIIKSNMHVRIHDEQVKFDNLKKEYMSKGKKALEEFNQKYRNFSKKDKIKE